MGKITNPMGKLKDIYHTTDATSTLVYVRGEHIDKAVESIYNHN